MLIIYLARFLKQSIASLMLEEYVQAVNASLKNVEA